MKIFSNLFQKQSARQNQLDDESAGSLMLIGILTSSNLVFDDEWTDYKKRKGGTIELIILSSLLVLRRFKDELPLYYDSFERDLFREIYRFAKQEGIEPLLPCDFADFMNSRFALYDEEFSLDEEGDVRLPARTTFNLFEKPLQARSGVCEDLFKIVEFQLKFQTYYERLMVNFDFLVLKKYPSGN